MIDLALDNRVYINNDLDEALQELDILFDTECTELLGDTEFGVNIEQFLWTLSPMTESIKSYISNKLNNCTYLQKFNYTIDVQYLEGDFRSMYHLIINIYIDEHQKIKKEYDFR